MAYIGKTPTVGNFQVCDAISVVNNQAAYTMQVGGVNVSPESANHMIVSLNGVIQKPTDAFTVSGSTITFASNLVTGDVINFIQILGNVLDLGVPSDATVTTAKIVDANVTLAKLSATGTKNSTTFLRGDNTFDTPVAGGITDFDSWRMTANVTASSGVLNGSWERQDTFSENIKLGTGMSESSGVFTFPSTGIWKIEFWTNLVPAGSYGYNGFYVEASANSGTNFSNLNGAWGSTSASGKSTTIGASNFLNVSNASNYRVQVKASGAGNAEYQANTNVNYTYFNFIRLGDST